MPEAEFLTNDPINDDEPISRFLTDEDEFYKNTNRVHHSAFRIPNNRKFSVYRTKDLNEHGIWELAQKFVTELRSDHKEVLARAELKAFAYKEVNLFLHPDGNPHPRHVNVEGWPSEDLLGLRKGLANKARLIIKN